MSSLAVLPQAPTTERQIELPPGKEETMCPLVGNPAALSPETLKLFDHALGSVWHDYQMEIRKARSAEIKSSDDQPGAKQIVMAEQRSDGPAPHRHIDRAGRGGIEVTAGAPNACL